MPEPVNLIEDVIADATDDALDASAQLADVPVDPVTTDPVADADPLAPDADLPVDPATAAQDEFEKRWGIPAISASGRPNRIPHPRVKQMVTKAEADAIARTTKEMEAKWATERTPLETKVKDYEGRLEKVAQFEHVLENDPRTFLSLLSQIPAYKDFFDHINKLTQGQATPTAAVGGSRVPEGMPQPDQTLPDGTKVYSMEGLQSLLQWQAENVEKRVTQKVQQHYAPIEQEWQHQQRMAKLVPVIEKQIADARTWPHFAELEPEVIKILKSDPQITLERAYVKAFQDIQVPKVSADRNQIRSEVLAELRKKPMNSSAPSSQVRPGTGQSNENRSIEDVIAQAARDAGLV